MDREKVKAELDEIVEQCRGMDYIGFSTITEHCQNILALLKEQEAVVRCKDCEHCYFASNRIPSEQNYACGKHGFDVVPDWYCADGERKPTQTNAKNNALDVR